MNSSRGFKNIDSTHSVLERIWIKGSYPSQWLPQGEGDPLRSQNHDELKSSMVGPRNKKKN